MRAKVLSTPHGILKSYVVPWGLVIFRLRGLFEFLLFAKG